MPIEIHFSDQDWQRIARDWNAWWSGELERALVVLETCLPSAPAADWSQLTRFGLDTPVEAILDNWQSILEQTRFHGDAYPKWWVNCGAGMMAGFLGSRVTWTPDTTWFWPLEGVNSLADIQIRYDPRNPWWLRVQELTRRAVERWGSRVLVGITDIGGNLDILAALRGSEKLLLDLSDSPQEVARLVAEITPLWLRYYDELEQITSRAGRGNACWGPVWSPGRGYMLQSDFAYMISPRMFRRFVLPDLEACCARLDYGFYHLDGKGQLPHLDLLLGIERLRGIQWQPGDGQPMAEGWLDLLARIRSSGKRCQIYVTRAGAFQIKQALGGRGFLMHIIDDPMSPEEAEAFLDEFQRDSG
jgi:5-methyltetrahydrofolate--homocysteine methyltransferase